MCFAVEWKLTGWHTVRSQFVHKKENNENKHESRAGCSLLIHQPFRCGPVGPNVSWADEWKSWSVSESPRRRTPVLTLGIFNFWWRYFTDMLAEQMLTEHVRNFTVPPPTNVDTVRIKSGYEDVRSDFTDTQWAVFKYTDTTITLSAKGKDFEGFKQQFEDNERCYGYIRFQTGDEMSKRTKFILVTWIGKDVGVMHRAKVTNDKSLVKQVITNYAVEFQLESNSELDEDYFKEELTKIGGTKYGTGVNLM